MKLIGRAIIVAVCLLLIPVAAVATAAIKQRFADGPNRVFSGGPLVSGQLYSGSDPNWAFVNQIPTIEMQLEAPGTSRRIWIAEDSNRIYVWSGYMGSLVGRVWKQWPVQAQADGRAILRIDGIRYERQLQRVPAGEITDSLIATMNNKYRSGSTRADFEAGNIWLFEAMPRQ